jgi:hypothetical protein
MHLLQYHRLALRFESALINKRFSMSARALIVCLFFCSVRSIAFAQINTQPTTPPVVTDAERMTAYEDTLAVLSFSMQNDTAANERLIACHQMIRVLKTALKSKKSFQHPFARLKAISILAPPDSTFRIFTWQLFVNDSTYKYYGAIQMNTPELKLFPLIDRGHEIADPLSETLTHDRWLGSLYYSVMPFGTKKQRQYLLCGFDGHSFFERQKLVDVLSFDAAGKPQFGAEVFDWPQDYRPAPDQKRIILQYSAEAKVRCNYDPLYEMVLFDHLIESGTSFGTVTNVPDGSYDGLRLEKGRWKYINKVFNDIQAEAPSVAPPPEKGKDLFGRRKKGGSKP